MTKSEILEKMNLRHGTDHADYFALLVWLRRAADRLEHKAAREPMYADQAGWLAADYAEALAAMGDK
jgi:hypothetical protein